MATAKRLPELPTATTVAGGDWLLISQGGVSRKVAVSSLTSWAVPSWSSLSGKPNTVAGFGITDAYTQAQVDTLLSGKAASTHTHSAATTGSAGFMSAADKAKLDGVAPGATAYAHPSSHPPSIITQDAANRFVTDAEKAAWDAKQAAIGFTPENPANKGAANGYAGLDATGKVPSAQLPSFVDDVLEFASLAAFPATGEAGKIYVALDTNRTYRWSGSAYVYITSGAVDSVAGKTGVVTLAKADVGLGNVDNTSDASKPISTAAATALAGKENSISAGSTAQFFRGDKTWQDLFGQVRAATLTGLSVATNAAIAAADTVLGALGKLQAQITAHFGSGGTAHANATTSVAGFMAAADKEKLEGIIPANLVSGGSASGSNAGPGATWSGTHISQYKSGFWDQLGASWTPDAGWWWGMTAAHANNSGTLLYGGQLVIQHASNPKVYVRTLDGGAAPNANPWRQVWHEGSDGSGSGLDADLLDGVHKVSLFSQVGNAGSGYDFGEGSYFGLNSYYDTTWRARNTQEGWFAFRNGGNGTGLQLFVQDGAVTAGATVTFDNYAWRDGDMFSGVNKFWHAGNDGAGSGMDADLLDGQHGDFYRNAGSLNAGTLPEGRMVPRLGQLCQLVTDWNSATANGYYMAPAAANAPTAGVWYIGHAVAHTDRWVTQTVWQFSANSDADTGTWRRESSDGGSAAVWGPWVRVWQTQSELDARYARMGVYQNFNNGLATEYGLPASTTMAAHAAGMAGPEVRSQGTGATAGAAMMTFHRPSAYAAFFGLDTDNMWKVGGWSMGAVAYKLWHEGSDGPGSGLDADLLDGQQGSYYQNASNLNAGTLPAARLPTDSDRTRKITISTAQPTGGSDGDLWFVYAG